MNIRIGYGYDIHRLREGRRLVLGGVTIEHDKGLEGHSDADVVAHAVIDALLGAAGAGDIGTHFPDTDPQFAGADSIELLRRAVGKLKEQSWKIGNVDVTVVAQRPRLAPHVAEMRNALAEAMGIGADRISVKAKTNEGLDAAGTEEAIVAHAVALLHRFLLFKEL